MNKGLRGFIDDLSNSDKRLLSHFRGEFPEELSKRYQQSEAKWVFDFKRDTYQSVAQGYIMKVLWFLQAQISKADDFIPNIPKQEIEIEGETLHDYLFENYPFSDSFVSDFFGRLFYEQLLDSKGYSVCVPYEVFLNNFEVPYEKPAGDIFVKPVIINVLSENILKRDKNYLKFKHIYGEDKVEVAIIEVDDFAFYRLDKNSSERTILYVHQLGYAPIRQNGGIKIGRTTVSFLAPMKPYLEDGTLYYLDAKTNFKIHAFPEKAIVMDSSINKLQNLETGKVEPMPQDVVTSGTEIHVVKKLRIKTMYPIGIP